MSGANAIHGVVVIGAIIIMGQAESENYLALILGFIAVVVGTLNVIRWFLWLQIECWKCLRRKVKHELFELHELHEFKK